MISENHIPVIIVSYRNVMDVVECLSALGELTPEPPFDIFVCENGGSAAFDALVSSLSAANGLCDHAGGVTQVDLPMPRFLRLEHFRLRSGNAHVIVAEARENFGYAGAVNAWLRVFLAVPVWPGVWVLNPDTYPEPRALAELVAVSSARQRGMVGSRIVHPRRPGVVVTQGLQWRRGLASTKAIGRNTTASIEPDLGQLEALLTAPSGVSMFVTRQCIEHIGLMDEQYFLYFEDLEWGHRAKTTHGIGYAHGSVVWHKGGTTIGSAPRRSKASAFSVYLDFRNRVKFVRQNYHSWIAWTLPVLVLRSLEYGLVGAFANMGAALRGLYAGIFGEIGRPDRLFEFDGQTPGMRGPARAPSGRNRQFLLGNAVKRRVKIGVSIAVYLVTEANHLLCRAISRQASHQFIILYYHGVPANLRSNFSRQLDMLSTRVKIVPADYHEGAGCGERSVAITFDDAYTSVLDNAIPELRARGMPATIFIPLSSMGRQPDWEIETGSAHDTEMVATADALRTQISELVNFGAHSLTHPHLTQLPREQARAEIAGCRKLMSDVFGIDVRVFAFPYGDHDAATVELCREAGYQRVFTNIPRVTDPASSEFVRGRVLVNAGDGPLEFYLKMSGAYAWTVYAYTVKRWLLQFLRRVSQLRIPALLHR